MNIQKIGDRTAELLNLYYNNEIEPFLNSCHEDVLWIGPADKQVIRGRKNLVDAFHAEKHELILSRLVDTFSSRILYPMLLLSGNHSIAVV